MARIRKAGEHSGADDRGDDGPEDRPCPYCEDVGLRPSGGSRVLRCPVCGYCTLREDDE